MNEESNMVLFDDVNALEDYVPSDKFNLIFSRIPGNGETPRNINIKCKTVEMSGVDIEQVKINLHGHELNRPGRRTFSGTFTSSLHETVSMKTRKAMRAWANMCRAARTQAGRPSKEFMVDCVVEQLDTTGNVIGSNKRFNVWIMTMDPRALDGSSTEAIGDSITWSYDIDEDIGEDAGGSLRPETDKSLSAPITGKTGIGERW
jgi:hypothetical protein